MNNQIKKGDILFSFGTSFINDLIEDFTHEGASHTAVCDGNGKVVEAQGFRKVGYNDLSFYSSNIKIYRLPNSLRNRDIGFRWLLLQFGRPYSFWDIFILGLKLTLKLKLPWREGKALICSRLVRNFIFQCRFNIPDENMTPRDVEDWIVANGGELIVDNVGKLN